MVDHAQDVLIEVLEDIINNGPILLIGYGAFLVADGYDKLKRDYKRLKGELLPRKIDASKIKVPVEGRRSVNISQDALDRLTKNQFYSDIKWFNDVVESNFNENELNNYYKNIRKAKICNTYLLERSSLKKRNIAGQYSSLKNKIQLVDPYSIFHELFHLASTNSTKFIGFRQEAVGQAINEGYTELMCKKYFPGYSDGAYYAQTEIANYLDKIVGREKMEELYLTSDLRGLINELKKYAPLKDIEKFIANTDYILYMERLSMSMMLMTISRLKKINILNQDRINILKANTEIEDFLMTCIENKAIIEYKEKGHCDDLDINLEDLYLILKLRNMDMDSSPNNCKLNKDLSDRCKHIITGVVCSSHSFLSVFYDIELALGYREMYDGYLVNGFQGVIDEMKKYLTEDEIHKLIENYELADNFNIDGNYKQSIEAKNKIKRLLLTYDLKKTSKLIGKFSYNFINVRTANIIKNYFYNIFPMTYDYQKDHYIGYYEEEEYVEALNEIYNEFADNRVIGPVLRRIKLLSSDELFNNKDEDAIKLCNQRRKKITKVKRLRKA